RGEELWSSSKYKIERNVAPPPNCARRISAPLVARASALLVVPKSSPKAWGKYISVAGNGENVAGGGALSFSVTSRPAMLKARPALGRAAAASSAVELRRPFFHEGAVALVEIGRLHALGLRARFHFQGAPQIGGAFALEQLFGHADGAERTLLQPARPGHRLLHQIGGGHDPIGEADAVSFLRIDRIAEIDQLRCLARADDARQEPERAHVRAREPDLDEQKSRARGVGKNPQVGGEHQHRAGAGGDAVHGGDDRLF